MKHHRPAKPGAKRALGIAFVSILWASGLAWAQKRIEGCPATPNCVSSRAIEGSRYVKPFPVVAAPDRVWSALRDAVAAEPRTRIVEEDVTHFYLRAECESRIFQFIDDLEFQLIPGERIVHVRSAARAGSWDLGVNRRRVERIRDRLVAKGLIPASISP